MDAADHCYQLTQELQSLRLNFLRLVPSDLATGLGEQSERDLRFAQQLGFHGVSAEQLPTLPNQRHYCK